MTQAITWAFVPMSGAGMSDRSPTIELISLEQAVYRLTTLPATNLGIKERGALKPVYYADVVVFDPAKVADRSTFEDPHQYSVGVRDVFVNGVAVLRNGEHSGATPGRAVRGPGRRSASPPASTATS